MASRRKCPRCEREVEGETLDGLCPQCLLGEGVAVDKAGELSEDVADGRGNSAHPPGISRFGDYELLEVIAHGGMGMVYKARQRSLNRLVAIKMLLFGAHSSPAAIQRLRAEAVAAASLHHPNIVAIHEVGLREGQHFLAMDYVEGRALSALIAGKPLPPRRAAIYLRTIAEAIHHAHEHGILHRDLKPSNVLIDQNDQPRLTDFGLAKRLESDSNLTVSGQVLGSPNYMSPEQAGGKRGALTRRSDIYSLGAMLYEMLTGRPPFIGESLAEIVPQVLNSDAFAPRALNPSVPLDLQTVCLKCLEKEPEKRYPTALALAEDLGRFLESKPVMARPVSRLGKSWRWCRRQPVRAGLLAGLLVTFTLGALGILWQWRRAEQQRLAAQANELRAHQSEYAADISLAQLKLGASDIGEAISLLNKYRPDNSPGSVLGSASPDLRHWEWRYLRQLCQSDERFTLYRGSNWVESLGISTDGKFLAVRQGAAQIAVWDLATRRSVLVLPAPAPSRARNLAFVPGTGLLAVGNLDPDGHPEIAVWDAAACRQKQRFPVAKPVRALSFSRDGKWLAILHQQGEVTILDFASTEILRRFSTGLHSSRDSGDLFFSQDGNRLVVGQLDGRILVRDWRTESEPLELPSWSSRFDEVLALAGSPAKGLIAWSNGDASTNIWLADFASGELLGELKGHADWVVALSFSPDGQFLASASADRTIRLWNVAQGKEVRRLQGHRDEVWCLGFLPDGETLVSGGKDGTVRLWNLTATNLTPSDAILPARLQRRALTFAPDGQTFITAGEDRSVRLWSIHPLSELERLSFLGTNALGADLSADGRWLAVADCRGTLGVWDWSTRRVITNLNIPPAERGEVRFYAGSKYLIVAVKPKDSPLIRLGWEMATWKRLPEGPDLNRLGVYSMTLSPRGGLWATGHRDGKVKFWTFPAPGAVG